MIDWTFDDCPKFTHTIGTIIIPIQKGEEKYEDDWIYKKYNILVRIVCDDGTFLVVVGKEF